MKTRSLAAAVIAVLVLNIMGLAFADTRSAAAKRVQAAELLSLLPASDGVALLDNKRFFSESMPRILASNQPMLASIDAHLNEMQAKTGVDLRKFDAAVVGVTMTKVNEKEYDFDPVAIIRGDIKAATLIAIAKLASNGSYREEKFGERSIFVFSAKEAVKNTAAGSTTKLPSMVDRTINGFTNEIAITLLDSNTFALGSLARVRATIQANTHVSPDVLALLSGKESSTICFALKTPGGMSKLIPLDNDELGANIDSIRFVSGSLDTAAAGTNIQIMAQTVKPEQAQSLFETLDGLKSLGKIFLGNSKRADQKIYARMIENARISRNGNDVSLDLMVAQPDIDLLVGAMK